ncbi:MAG: c-type cytochrome [Epsilonproteobacteria bacterium]|nr:c-type cytochrome [Campylobacterota bacterium]
MIRHIIALIAIALAIWAWVYMYNLDMEVNKYQKISELIEATKMEDKKIDSKVNKVEIKTPQTASKKEDDEMERKLKALKEKAGNISAFKVSPLYKKNCASCHGNIGEGIIGPKLIGQSKEQILQALYDFKSGKRKNYVMYGLLNKLSDKELETLAAEIATFEDKLKNAK